VKILCIAQALAGCAAMLVGCGQKGPLVLPNTPESQGRATLPQTLNPLRRSAPEVVPPAVTPAAPIASEPDR